MLKPVEVKALPNYRLWLRYSNGTEGEVDLSDLAGKGIFKVWDDYNAFENVHIGEQREIAWSDQIDLCPDALYLRLTGRSPEEIFPSLRETSVNA
ncbi:hypothetical protein C1752_02177 [Acaryochloris thomasi RCC1774]|uniref:DUF2442 domain-containing protein n=1 Tax=Acaryochloris thomasi RCC1774 TaxID=1764569 RepID=A0A2W1JXJ9_9CYAN|nr:DUF2442 domain-containing protein [Acaryochloris thomasi]PZD73361.1 hypothetical protein C1752_02177 [Acaryochloris thomasi RCC1774]